MEGAEKQASDCSLYYTLSVINSGPSRQADAINLANAISLSTDEIHPGTVLYSA
jgi:hypothetical protein